MGTRLGTDYAHYVAPTNTYQALKGDDIIMPVISTGKTITMPAISSLGPDDKEKIIGNDSTSAGNATYAAASGDSIKGLAVMLPGQSGKAVVQGRSWVVFGAVVDSGTGTTATSVADSKAESAVSTANSKAASNSVVGSTNLTVVNSAVASTALKLSTTTSSANSA